MTANPYPSKDGCFTGFAIGYSIGGAIGDSTDYSVGGVVGCSIDISVTSSIGNSIACHFSHDTALWIEIFLQHLTAKSGRLYKYVESFGE